VLYCTTIITKDDAIVSLQIGKVNNNTNLILAFIKLYRSYQMELKPGFLFLDVSIFAVYVKEDIL